MFNRNSGFKENPNTKNDRYITGGFVEKKMREYNPTHLVNKNALKFEPLPYQQSAFDQIVQLTSSKGIKLFVVQAPVTRAEIESYSNYGAADSFFQSRATYTNFNYKLKLQDSIHFFDKVHLNQSGVKKFDSAVIVDILKPWFKR